MGPSNMDERFGSAHVRLTRLERMLEGTKSPDAVRRAIEELRGSLLKLATVRDELAHLRAELSTAYRAADEERTDTSISWSCFPLRC